MNSKSWMSVLKPPKFGSLNIVLYVVKISPLAGETLVEQLSQVHGNVNMILDFTTETSSELKEKKVLCMNVGVKELSNP